MTYDLTNPHRILHEAIDAYEPVAIWCGYSGGDDSLCSVHVAMSWLDEHAPDTPHGVLHINTGIGIERTRQHVRETAARFGWPYREERTPICYDDIVIKHGFPGPSQHQRMYTSLKERAIDAVMRDNKRGHPRTARVLFVTGIRRSESTRRRERLEHHKEHGHSRCWAAPILYWTDDDKRAYIEDNDLPRNPVSKALCMSGECLCGAYAHPGELAEIESVCPATAQRIRDLETKVRAAGHDWGWEARGPSKAKPTRGGVMCVGCERRVTKDLFAILDDSSAQRSAEGGEA